jgi:hypothetical protein
MKVKFLLPWQGSSVGDIIELVPFLTDDLINRGIVEPYVDESKQDAKVTKLENEVAELKRKLAKQIDTAPNKQVKRPVKKK